MFDFKIDAEENNLIILVNKTLLCIFDAFLLTWQQLKYYKADKRTIQNNLLQRVTIIGC